MPVDFDKLPPKEAEPDKPPSRFVWTIVFFVITLAGIFAALFFWPKGEPTQTLWFWICVTVYPTGAAAFVVLRRYSIFEGRRLDAIAWNEARERHMNAVFEEASRPLAVVAAAYRFASDAIDDTFDKLLDGAIRLEPRIAPKPDTPPVNARWFDKPYVDENGERFKSDDERRRRVREWVFGALIDEVGEAVRALPSDLKLAVQLVLPDVAKTDEALVSWDEQWAKRDLRPRRAEVLPEPPTLMYLDAWLDRINHKVDQQARLLVFVQLSPVLQALPEDGSTEIGLALLLMPEAVQRRAQIQPVARLHRPNGSDGCTVDVALERALRWGRVEPAAVSGIWQSTLGRTAANAATAAVVKAGMSAKPANIDYMAGQAGDVSPWFGVVCGARAVARNGSTQLVVTTSKTGPCFTILRSAHT
jgi:hypothetical protein